MSKKSCLEILARCVILVPALLFCFCGSALSSETALPSYDWPFYESFSLLDPGTIPTIRIAQASEEPKEPLPAVPAGAELKSPTKAGLLGGFLGFGSGQYYTKGYYSGTFFLIVDAASLLYMASGIAVAADIWDEDDLFPGKAMGTTMFAVMASLGGVVLIASHVAQAIWGPIKARSYNEKLSNPQVKLEPLIIPVKDGLVAGVAWRF